MSARRIWRSFPNTSIGVGASNGEVQLHESVNRHARTVRDELSKDRPPAEANASRLPARRGRDARVPRRELAMHVNGSVIDVSASAILADVGFATSASHRAVITSLGRVDENAFDLSRRRLCLAKRRRRYCASPLILAVPVVMSVLVVPRRRRAAFQWRRRERDRRPDECCPTDVCCC